jgi:signal peptidase I
MRAWWPVVPVVAVVAGTWLRLLRRRLFVVTVRGLSMRPTLQPGDRLLARRVPLARVRVGQVVVVAAPDHLAGVPWLVKRVVALPGDPVPPNVDPGRASWVPPDCFLVLGDNAAVSRDSRHLGFLAGGDLLGVVVRRLGTDAGRSTGARTVAAPVATADLSDGGRRAQSSRTTG